MSGATRFESHGIALRRTRRAFLYGFLALVLIALPRVLYEPITHRLPPPRGADLALGLTTLVLAAPALIAMARALFASLVPGAIELAGEATARVAELRGLDKAYELRVLFGAATDSYDVLGLPGPLAPPARPFSALELDRALERFRGRFEQPFPPFSAARVRGRALYHWAREGTLDPAEVPAATRTVYSAEVLGVETLDGSALGARVRADVSRVAGDFRQERVLAQWEARLREFTPGGEFPVARLRVECSSGTYMRALAHALGAALGAPALALHIVRTRVGEHTLARCVRLEQ